MAKIVDHDEKRREIQEVTALLIAREGLDAVTTRRIASESGCSLGILSHYFANKDEIVVSALNWCDLRFIDELAVLSAQESLDLDSFYFLIDMLLPLDERSDAEWRVRVNLWAYSLTHPELAQARREAAEFGYDMARKFIGRLQEKNQIREDIETETLAIIAVDAIVGFCQNLINFPLEERIERKAYLYANLPLLFVPEK